MFGPVRMRSDAFGCNRIHFGALGCVRTLPEIFGFFGFFLNDFDVFWIFRPRGAYYFAEKRIRGLITSGANYPDS